MPNVHPHISIGDRVSIPYGLGGARRTGVYIEDLGLGWIRVQLDQTNERVPSLATAARQVTVAEELAEETLAAEYKGAGILQVDHRGDPREGSIVEPDPLVRVWQTMNPKTRRRIERASRPLAALLDERVIRDREAKS